MHDFELRVRRLEQQLLPPEATRVTEVNYCGRGRPSGERVLSYQEYVAEFDVEPSPDLTVRVLLLCLDGSVEGD